MTLHEALNKLAKWRTVFASWQLGTRSNDDPECQAVRDHREATILLRAELTALTTVLIKKGVFTDKEFGDAMVDEAILLDKDFEKRFPGFKTHQYGIDIDSKLAQQTMRGWRP